MRVVPTYLVLSSVVLVFALLLSQMKFPSIASEDEAGGRGTFKALLHYPHLWFAVIATFCNVGAQVSTWSSLIPYMKQYTTVSERTAAGYLTATLVAFSIGRFFSTKLMEYIPASNLLSLYGAANVVLLSVAIVRPGMQGAYTIVASSFFLSIMFPTVFALGLKDLGPNTKLAGSFLVMAVAGGAVLPPILGLIARETGSVAHGYVVPLMGFAVVSIYGFLARRKVTP